MLTLSNRPKQIVAKTRRGLSQNYEKFETIKEIGKKSSELTDTGDFNVPRPVFQTNKRSLSHNRSQLDEETLTPQHEEIVKYITESWNMVVAQNPYDSPAPADKNTEKSPPSTSTSFNCSNSTSINSSSMYCVEPPSPALTDFKPFDLESWWGRRLFNNITKSL